MLPAAHRLRRSNDFASTVRGGRRSSRGSVVVHITFAASGMTQPADIGDEPVKAGFVVSKAVGGAVIRNKVKRRLRHLVAERLADLPPGTCLVVRALPKAGLTAYQDMGMDLDAGLAQALKPRQAR